VGVARPFTGRLGLLVEAFPPDRRVRDLDGLFKALLDALEHAHVFQNDSQIVLLAAQKLAPAPGGQVQVTLTRC
jgi:crossover junction endodeoxyribonuclease RusA